ncbi:nucleotidyl transferase AbiEii/AbiGii toxin family protein [Corynebacterium sp. H128]|uniref:nucleotidyl transferase AbiEii/AbiGii toxin family protein n=1 Tax=unclassified Corynebacterium TaxID=2624378 RepID=UPI0030B23A97
MNQTLSPVQARNLQRSLNTRIGNLSKETGRSRDSLRSQLVFQCFLKRVFSSPSEWVLKGGTALLMRNGDGRFTRDIDLARSRAWNDISEIRQEFERIAQLSGDDGFVFKVSSVGQKSVVDDGYATPTAEVKVEVRLGAKRFHTINIDVSLRRHTQIPLEKVYVDPLLNELLGESKCSSFTVLVTAIEAHLADKICAMFEPHRNGVSMRFHDLADIIQIIRTQNFSAEKFLEVLHHEVARRRMDWPARITSPGPVWEEKYPINATQYAGLPRELQSLQSSLDYAGSCLNEVLKGERTQGTWKHEQLSWVN